MKTDPQLLPTARLLLACLLGLLPALTRAETTVQAWVQRHNGRWNNNDSARALAVDSRNDVVVTGFSYESGSSSDYTTIKYSSAGVVLWTNYYDGPGNGTDGAWAVAVDGPGGFVELQNDDSLTGDLWSWNAGAIYNQGLLRKSGGAGTSRVEPPLNNSGLLDVQQGSLQLPVNTSLAGGQINCGLSSASDYGRIVFDSSVSLTGTLSAELLGGYTPAPGTSFQVISSDGISGGFTALDLPDRFFVTNNATKAFLIVGGGGPVDLVGPALVGTNFTFGFQSEAGQTYTVQRNDDLSMTNWLFYSVLTGNGGLMGFTTSATNAPQRFFRVRQP